MIHVLHYLHDARLWELWHIGVLQDLYHQQYARTLDCAGGWGKPRVLRLKPSLSFGFKGKGSGFFCGLGVYEVEDFKLVGHKGYGV